MPRQRRAVAGPVELLDAMVAFFTPANIRDRFAIRKHLKQYLKASFRRHIVKNLITAVCICFAVTLVMVIVGYVNGLEKVYTASSPVLRLPCDLVFGKQDTSHLLRGAKFRPPAAFPAFTPREMSLVRSIEAHATDFGLRTNIEINGDLYEGFVFPSTGTLAKAYGVSKWENTIVLYGYPANEADVTVWFDGKSWTYSEAKTKPGAMDLDYPQPKVPVLFVTNVPPVYNQAFFWTSAPKQAQEKLVSTWEYWSSETDIGPTIWTGIPKFWTRVISPWYVITRDSPQQILLAAKQETTDGVKMLLYVSFAVMVLVVYNILFVSYFTRQREGGILKTVGFTSHEIYVLLQTEAVICSLAGIILAVLLSRLTFALLPQFSAIHFSLSIGQQALISLGALVVFYLGSIFPVGLLRDTPVMRLLRQEALKRAS